ncbi:MAG: glycosyltransferase family 39 protein [Aggregatilineales bacterium]
MRKTIPYVPLVMIFLLGFLVLTYQLDKVALWADEGWTIGATNASDPLVTVRDWVAIDVHPPLFFVGLDGWRVFTGDTIFELRYFSVMVSMVGIAVAFRLGKSLYGTRAGLFAGLFYTLHDLIKVLTQEVRHYSGQMMLSTLTVWMYWRFWKQPTRGRGIAFVLAGTALIYTHYWGGFVLLGLAIHALLTQRKHIKPFIYAFVAIGLLYLPWIPVLIHQITLERPGGLPHALPNTSTVYAVLTFQLLGIPELLWVVLCVVGAIGAFTLKFDSLRDVWKAWKPTPATLLPLPIIILTPVLSILLNNFYPTLSFRSLAVIIPLVMVLAAHGLSRFRLPEQTAVLVFIVLFSLSKTGSTPLQRAPWEQIGTFMTQHATESDVILLELDTDVDPMAYYLSQAANPTDYVFSERVRETEPDAYPALMQDTLSAHDGIWVAKLGWAALDGDVRSELMARGYVQTAPEIAYGAYLDEGGMFVWRLDRPPQTDPLTVYSDPQNDDNTDSLILRSAEVDAHPDGVTVNLLWAVAATPSREYTISAFVLGADGAFMNHDSAPFEGRSATTTWTADGVYFDSHLIDTSTLPAGEYQVGVAVYAFTDQTFTEIRNLSADDCSDAPDDCRFIFVGTVTLE